MSNPYIIYLSPYDILRPRTNQLSDVRFTEGFAQNQCNTHLIVPYVERADNISKMEVAETYGLKSHLKIHYSPTRFSEDVKGGWQLAQVAWHGIRSTFAILKQRKHQNTTYIISRSSHLLRPYFTLRKLFPSRFKNVVLIHWAHDFNNSKNHQKIYQLADYIIATNSSILNSILKKSKRNSTEGSYTLNPITESQALEHFTKEEARNEVKLNHITTPLVVYTGKIGINYDKELKYILEAAQQLPQYTFLFTGGKPKTVAFWEDYCAGLGLNNILFTGYLSDYRKIKYYQYSADILISYYTQQGHDVRYNFPNKICEYMLTGNPMVSPNYPATQDLLNANNCTFTTPENSKALAKSLRDIIENPLPAQQKAQQAALDVREITFKKVAARLLKQFPK
ncbi:MAG: glycosyltransferase [Bacteroidetes bacterium]|nr:glycosyltransferase [Bacteroidota bacterium]